MANNPFDPPIVQVKKVLDRGGIATVNKGYGSLKTAQGKTRPAPAGDPAASGATVLSELTDVDVAGLVDGQVLVWNATTGKWDADDLGLDALSDVDTSTVPPTFGQALVWDGSQWEPGTVGGGGGGGSINDRRYVIGPGETSIDEFSDTTIDPAWVRVDPSGAAPGNVSWKEDVGQLMAIHTVDVDNSSALHALLRPATPLAIGEAFYCAFTIYGHPSATYVMGGLILADGATAGSGLQLVNLNYTEGNGNLNSDMRRFANFNSEQGSGSGTLIPGTGILNYSRIVRVTSDTYRIDTSPNGVGWVPGTPFQWGGSPTHVGFYNTNWGSNRAGVVTFEFLRRMVAIAPPPPLPATITRTWSSDGMNGIMNAVAMNSGSFMNPSGNFSLSAFSTFDGTRTPSRATDGVTAQEYHSQNNGLTQWWQVDFGATRRLRVTRYGIAGRNEGSHLPRNFELQGSQDGATWTVLQASGNNGPAINAWWSAAVSEATPWRYVRIRQVGTNSQGDTYFVLGEVEFWGTLSTV